MILGSPGFWLGSMTVMEANVLGSLAPYTEEAAAGRTEETIDPTEATAVPTEEASGDPTEEASADPTEEDSRPHGGGHSSTHGGGHSSTHGGGSSRPHGGDNSSPHGGGISRPHGGGQRALVPLLAVQAIHRVPSSCFVLLLPSVSSPPPGPPHKGACAFQAGSGDLYADSCCLPRSRSGGHTPLRNHDDLHG